jgi:hypothetical protein
VPADEHYLDTLLSDLARKVNETPDQRHKVIEMGCLVEVVHRALLQCLLKKPSNAKSETLEAYWQSL